MKIEDELKIISERLDKIMKPTSEPKDKFGNTKAQKDKMVEDWLTRPKTKPWDDPKFFQKKLPTKEKEKFKYTSWANDRTTPQPVGSGISKTPKKAMNIIKYIDTVNKLYGDKK